MTDPTNDPAEERLARIKREHHPWISGCQAHGPEPVKNCDVQLLLSALAAARAVPAASEHETVLTKLRAVEAALYEGGQDEASRAKKARLELQRPPAVGAIPATPTEPDDVPKIKAVGLLEAAAAVMEEAPWRSTTCEVVAGWLVDHASTLVGAVPSEPGDQP